MLRAVAILTLMAALPGCGNKAVDRPGAVAQANTICRDVAERFGRLAAETDRARYYEQAERINREGAALLRGIAAPAEMRAALRILADRIDTAARLYERAAQRASDGQQTADIEKAITRAGMDFVDRARALGMTKCGLP